MWTESGAGLPWTELGAGSPRDRAAGLCVTEPGLGSVWTDLGAGLCVDSLWAAVCRAASVSLTPALWLLDIPSSLLGSRVALYRKSPQTRQATSGGGGRLLNWGWGGGGDSVPAPSHWASGWAQLTGGFQGVEPRWGTELSAEMQSRNWVPGIPSVCRPLGAAVVRTGSALASGLQWAAVMGGFSHGLWGEGGLGISRLFRPVGWQAQPLRWPCWLVVGLTVINSF